MSRRVVRLDDMRIRRGRDPEIDTILARPETSPDDPFAQLVADLRLVTPEGSPTPGARKEHLTSMLAHAATLTRGRAVRGDPRRAVPLRLVAKLAGSAVVLFGALTGAAYAHLLPEDVENVVAKVSGLFGIDIPEREKAGDEGRPVNRDNEGGRGAGDQDDSRDDPGGSVSDSPGERDGDDSRDRSDSDDGAAEEPDDDDNSGPGSGDEQDDRDERDDDDDSSGPGPGSDDDKDENEGPGSEDDDSSGPGSEGDDGSDDDDSSGPGGDDDDEPDIEDDEADKDGDSGSGGGEDEVDDARS